MGHFLESIPFFDQALAINPEFQEAQMYKGMALYFSGRHDEALDIEIFQKEFARRVQQEFEGKPETSA
jgi:lipoprotein NlpI